METNWANGYNKLYIIHMYVMIMNDQTNDQAPVILNNCGNFGVVLSHNYFLNRHLLKYIVYERLELNCQEPRCQPPVNLTFTHSKTK